jgi:hypothetical protein
VQTVTVRYIVDDVEAAAHFYEDLLGFTTELDRSPAFAIVDRGALRLLLNSPAGPGGASQPAADGRRPEPAIRSSSSSQPERYSDFPAASRAVAGSGYASQRTILPWLSV